MLQAVQFEAEEMLEEYNLGYLISGERFHPNIKRDLLLNQTPSGKVVKKKIVRLFVPKKTILFQIWSYARPYVEEKQAKGLTTEVMASILQYDAGIVIGQHHHLILLMDKWK